ncbi:uncharacterized protein Pyn_15412 [Prunus yedoensis var. nudiflora]|uniref:Uncharacterized protein n=1 Tax=Prunus yedoensis var. nudiflora TaxID=2094558 RepID=A0A314YLZ5_PRUYE|nr:uncharacterized protein Pyn_15412 [Prunus yedoensis var. nudiflora]
MSLRYVSRVVYQAGMRAMQGVKEQAPKCGGSSSSSSSSCSSKQAWRFSTSIDSGAVKAANSDKITCSRSSFAKATITRLLLKPHQLQQAAKTQSAHFAPCKILSPHKRKLGVRASSSGQGGEAAEKKSSDRRPFLTLEEAGLVEISGLSTHERFLCRLTISSLNLLRVISEQEGCPIEELNAGKVATGL